MWMEVGRVPKGVQKFTIRDLQEDHEYAIRIFARNEVGLSEPLEGEEPVKILPSGGKISRYIDNYNYKVKEDSTLTAIFFTMSR